MIRKSIPAKSIQIEVETDFNAYDCDAEILILRLTRPSGAISYRWQMNLGLKKTHTQILSEKEFECRDCMMGNIFTALNAILGMEDSPENKKNCVRHR